MKKLLLLLAAVAMIYSCAKDEIPEQPKMDIQQTIQKTDTVQQPYTTQDIDKDEIKNDDV